MGLRLGILAATVVLLCSVAPHALRMPGPPLMLWAWERPEDLHFIDPATTGVAYLAATASVQRDGLVRFRFREQTLATPPGTVRIAVVRIESPRDYVFPDPERVVEGLRAAAEQPGVIALQIDFDARASERAFYSAVLRRLRQSTSLPVGITALASWCDGWIDRGWYRRRSRCSFAWGRGESKSMPVTAQVCRGSVGVSMDEAWPALRAGRVYVFNPRAWTKSDYERAVRHE